MGIVELEKPRGTWCEHALPGRGCAIYDQRPDTCRAFSCLWLLNSALGEEWKPEKCKLVIVPDDLTKATRVYVDASSPDAWKREPYFSSLLDFMQKGLLEGRLLFINVGNKNSLLLPDVNAGWRLEDLGKLQEGDEVRLKRAGYPFATRYEVEVVRRSN
ncbi:MAG: hypothetical protein JO256_07240 [Alphaproteobacteria bacterium]|nr:hypothetical protein [Alphaproteobacteria bacterium]